MNTTQTNSEQQIREKRKRIINQYRLQGEIVAKSYVDSFHKKPRVTKQLVTYNALSYKVLKREILLTE